MINMKKTRVVLSLFTVLIAVFVFSVRLTADPAKDENGNLQLIARAEEIMEENPEEALSLLLESLPKILAEENPVQISRAYFQLGEAYFYLDRLEDAIAYYLKAAETDIASGNDKTPEHINILGNLGYMYDALDQKIIAMDFYERALAIARETNNREEIAANLANIGQLKTIQGFYGEALIMMEEALAIDRQIGDEAVIAIDLNTIGRIYESWGMFDKSVEYLEQALEIDRKMNSEAKMAIRYNSLGLAYKGWGKFEKARDHFEKALEIDLRLGNEQKVALRRANIGSTYLDMKQPDKAIPLLETALAFFLENDMPSYCASTLNDLGKGFMLQKQYGKAEAKFNMGAEICRENNLVRFLMNTLENLSELYRETGQDQKALASLSEFVSLKDSLFTAESQKKLAEFQAKFDLDRKQQQLELLQRDHELSTKRHTVTILVFSMAGLAMLSILLFIMIRYKISQNRRLIAEKENESLRKDLELRSKELTYNAMCIIKNNETVAKIAETIEDAITTGNNETGLNQLVRKLQNMERDKNWSEFEVRFTQVHEDFYKKLMATYPDLTPNEKKICAFLRLNMSTKDIAAITHQSVHSLNVARTRLRKKLGIDGTDENLVNFLNRL